MSRIKRYSFLIAAFLVVVLLAACSTTQQTGGTTNQTTNPPTNPPTNLTGDAAAGQQIFADNCTGCHGDQGTGGGGAPALSPARDTLKGSDATTFNQNLVDVITHGRRRMPAWGDAGMLTSQQIADVAAYIMSLNK